MGDSVEGRGSGRKAECGRRSLMCHVAHRLCEGFNELKGGVTKEARQRRCDKASVTREA